MQLELSARAVATLIVRLTSARLTPIAEAAKRHEGRIARTFIRSAQTARDAVPIHALEEVLSLGHSGTGAPLYLLEDVLTLWERELLGDGVEAAPVDWFRVAANKSDLPTVLSGALASGASASEVCVIPSGDSIVSATKGVAEHHVDNVKRVVSSLPSEFLSKVKSPVRVVNEILDRNGKVLQGAQGLFSRDIRPLTQMIVGSEKQRLVQILVSSGTPEYIAETTVHELGHAFQSTVRTTITDAFLSDVKAMDNTMRRQWAHYAAAEPEAFAQSVAHIFGFMGGRANDFASSFPNSIAATKKILKANGVRLP